MTRSTILLIDAFISLVLGVALAAFAKPLVEWLGARPTDTMFYPSILGAVVIGIAIALVLECRRKPEGPVGLGLVGAVSIDLCVAWFLAGWLLAGGLDLPVRGRILLWMIVVVLLCVSGLGLVAHRKQAHH